MHAYNIGITLEKQAMIEALIKPVGWSVPTIVQCDLKTGKMFIMRSATSDAAAFKVLI